MKWKTISTIILILNFSQNFLLNAQNDCTKKFFLKPYRFAEYYNHLDFITNFQKYHHLSQTKSHQETIKYLIPFPHDNTKLPDNFSQNRVILDLHYRKKAIAYNRERKKIHDKILEKSINEYMVYMNYEPSLKETTEHLINTLSNNYKGISPNQWQQIKSGINYASLTSKIKSTLRRINPYLPLSTQKLDQEDYQLEMGLSGSIYDEFVPIEELPDSELKETPCPDELTDGIEKGNLFIITHVRGEDVNQEKVWEKLRAPIISINGICKKRKTFYDKLNVDKDLCAAFKDVDTYFQRKNAKLFHFTSTIDEFFLNRGFALSPSAFDPNASAPRYIPLKGTTETSLFKNTELKYKEVPYLWDMGVMVGKDIMYQILMLIEANNFKFKANTNEFDPNYKPPRSIENIVPNGGNYAWK